MKMEQNTNTFSGKPQPEAAPHCFHDDLAGRMEQCGHILYHCMGAQRGQGKILRILSAQGDMSQKDLQDTLGIQPGSMSEIAAKLENKGYLVRVRDEADKRKILLSITDQGRQAWPATTAPPCSSAGTPSSAPDSRRSGRSCSICWTRCWRTGPSASTGIVRAGEPARRRKRTQRRFNAAVSSLLGFPPPGVTTAGKRGDGGLPAGKSGHRSFSRGARSQLQKTTSS